MKKIILTIFVFFLSFNIANACDITFVNFGDKSDKLIENQDALPFEDQFYNVYSEWFLTPNFKGKL